jgi:hypothetical protein
MHRVFDRVRHRSPDQHFRKETKGELYEKNYRPNFSYA